MFRRALGVAGAALLLPLTAPAQSGPAGPEPADPTGSRLEAVRLESGAIEIDGHLDESAWDRAAVAFDFVQGEPTEGAEPARATEVRVLYDSEVIYVGARMHESSPSAIADRLVRRDEKGQYDYFAVSLDPNLDQQTGYVFRVAASGVQRDVYVSGGDRRQVNWDAVWNSAVETDSAGWTVEARIPLSQIRFESEAGPQRWGINFVRRRLASNSVSYWSLESRTEQGIVSQWGRLTDLRFREAPGRFEVEPYVVSQLTSAPGGGPLTDATEFTPRVGGNVSLGVGSAFTLDATVNPDFGQVEVDPAVINLSAFETFFPEKRPFFVQDAQVFNFDLLAPNNRLFFSRRIGREPQGGAPPGADHAQIPNRTTILGATKFTGRTQGGLSVGGLTAVTAEERGRAFFSESGATREFVAEPTTEYAVGRVQQDFRGGASTVGGIVTGVHRHLPAGGRLDHLTDAAFTGGLDVTHQWGGANDRRWALSGYFVTSHVRGSREAMVSIQTNSQHYFQRPDAENYGLDSTRTRMTGTDWSLQFRRQSAEHWTGGLWMAETSPDFAVNDIGFNNRGPNLEFGGRVQYREIDPGPVFRSWRAQGLMVHRQRHTLLDDPLSPAQWARSHNLGFVLFTSRFEFHNNWWVAPQLEYEFQSLSHRETRGGPLMTAPSQRRAALRLSTDPRKTLSLQPNISYAERGLGAGEIRQAGLQATLRPSPNVELQLQPTVRDETDGAQYVATVRSGDYAPTYGDRYLFADLERTQVSMQTRLNAALTPDLSVQLFAQPLISAVDFLSIKQLAEPETFRFERFEEGEAVEGAQGVRCVDGRSCLRDGRRYIDFDGDGRPEHSLFERDFNLRSLRGNAVVRWEYRPGSTLFVVWQHDRRGRTRTGTFDFDRDLDALLAAEAEDRFIVKVSHFLDL